MNLYGGALQVHYLLRGLVEREDIQSVLVCPEGSAISEAALEYVQSLYPVRMRGDLDFPFIPRLIKIIRKEDPDIVHLHSRRGADILGGIAARVMGIPSILTRRVDNPESRWWANLKYRLYRRVITISDGIRQVLIKEGVPPGAITCIPSAVDMAAYSAPCDRSWFLKEFGLEENDLACGVVSQLIERKGHRYLLEAIPEILRAVPDVRFLLFGKGPLEEDLRVMCLRLGIEERVIFAGFRSDLERFLGCLDLLVHPALMEGLGVSLLQAAAAGVPIVSTRVGGIPEIVRDGVNGYLVPASNTSSIGEKTIKVLQDSQLRHRLGEKGREIVSENFSVDAMVNGNLAVYREVLGEKQ